MKDKRTDADLLLEVIGDQSALEELYRRHVYLVTRYAVIRCDQPADVADLVGSTFLAVLESCSRYDPRRGEVGPWIIGIAHQIHANRIRRRYRERAALSRMPKVQLTSDDVTALEERIDAARQAPHVEKALDRLRPTYQEILHMIARDGLTMEEASQALTISQTTLRKRLSRARAALRKELRDDRNQMVPKIAEEVIG